MYLTMEQIEQRIDALVAVARDAGYSNWATIQSDGSVAGVSSADLEALIAAGLVERSQTFALQIPCIRITRAGTGALLVAGYDALAGWSSR